MMLEEAAALVLQSAALSSARRIATEKGHDDSGCIYVLEMLRPGEKLTELLSYEDEDLLPTDVEGIQLYNRAVLDPVSVLNQAKKLIRALNTRDRIAIRKSIAQLVPGYDPAHVLDEPELAIVPNIADADNVANDIENGTGTVG